MSPDSPLRIGGVVATREQVAKAIDILESSRGTAVKRPLQAAGNPLADMDYHMVANAYLRANPGQQAAKGARKQRVARVKSALLSYLADQLADSGEESLSQSRSGDGSRGPCAGAYTDFRVLLDDPAEDPGLGFDAYAAALAEMAAHSRAEFSVGIFGGWGAGKTTLMRAIERQLGDDSIVTVWFSAWRYEREPHLIIPLLDVLRGELEKRAASAAAGGWAQNAAAAVGRAGRMFLAGLKLSAGLPGLQAELDVGKMTSPPGSGTADSGPLSYYHRGFVMLQEAISELSAQGSRRVVVFIDDLDRCLPPNALDVLESMKLFFDVEGCVFIVGLDQAIVEQAVVEKYGYAGNPEAQARVRTEYVRKIFQVPFALPSLSTRQLPECLSAIARNSTFGEAQRDDFDRNVRRHLRFLPGEDPVNPRDVKRVINAYTLQLKMLSARDGAAPEPNVVLALQCMSFRPDWRDLYERLAADPEYCQATMREAVREEPPADSVWLSGVKVVLPLGLPEYLRSEGRAVLDVTDLHAYISAAESTQSTDPSVLEARTTASRLRRSADEFASGILPLTDAVRRIPGDVRRLASLVKGSRPHGPSPQLQNALSQLDALAGELRGAERNDTGSFGKDWAARTTPHLDALDASLRELQRSVNVGTY